MSNVIRWAFFGMAAYGWVLLGLVAWCGSLAPRTDAERRYDDEAQMESLRRNRRDR